MKLHKNEVPLWMRKEKRQRRRDARKAKLSEIDAPKMSAKESRAMQEARARALEIAAEAAEIAAEEAKNLGRAARRKAKEEEKREKDRVASAQSQTPKKEQRLTKNDIPLSSHLYRQRQRLHRMLLLSMLNYDSPRLENDSDVEEPGNYDSGCTSDLD